MKLQIHNSLSGKKEPFTTLKPGEVGMYVCGPTVYGLTHIGNARPVVFFDVVRRYLESQNLKVTYVRNYTDVDDKIIDRARQEGVTSLTISEKYIEEFKKDTSQLGVATPDITPKVTEHIPEIIKFIEGLIAKGIAYVHEGEVFYSVRKFTTYGKLSKKKIDELMVGARVEKDETKKDPLDFSLWKPQKKSDEPAWDSPWGKGRPGWHIECSVMATQYLGESFDIHGGGMDLIHPHHENEIAQSEGLTDKPFARFWMHNNMLTLKNTKMSKSLGNLLLNREFVEKHGAETLRYMLLSGHYRSTLEVSEKQIRDSQMALHRIYSALKKCEAAPKNGTAPTPTEEKTVLDLQQSFTAHWQEAMDDDFNTPRVFALVFDYVRALNSYLDKKGFKPTANTEKIAQSFIENIHALGKVLGLFTDNTQNFLEGLKSNYLKELGIDTSWILTQIEERKTARAAKDFATADAIRNQLLEKGIELNDSPHGTTWDVKF